MISYDAQGNETSNDGRTSPYDVFNRTTTMSGKTLKYLSPTNGELVVYDTIGYRNNQPALGILVWMPATCDSPEQ